MVMVNALHSRLYAEWVALKERKSFDRFLSKCQPQMEDLKEAFKQGDFARAMKMAYSHAVRCVGESYYSTMTNRVLILVPILCTTDMEDFLFKHNDEGCSPLYRASRGGYHVVTHAGQREIVQGLLALFILDSSFRRGWKRQPRRGWKRRPVEAKPLYLSVKDTASRFQPLPEAVSMMIWLHHVAYHTWNEGIRHSKFDEEKLPWGEILNMVVNLDQRIRWDNTDGAVVSMAGAFSLNYQTQKTVGTKSLARESRKKHHLRLPKLCLDEDEFNPDLEGGHSMDELDTDDCWAHEETEERPSELEAKNDTTDVSSQLSIPDSFTVHTVDDHAIHAVSVCENAPASQVVCDETPNDADSQWTELDEKADSGVGVVGSPPSLVSGDSGFQLVHEHDDLSWNDDEMEGELSIMQSKDDLSCGTTDWEVLADSYSVISLDSSHHVVRKSYLDVLRENRLQAPRNQTERETRTVRSGKLPRVSELDVEEEEEIDVTFDACFAVEGVKEARGGKRTRMFKGEGRTQRSAHKSKR